jgi:hypothetical protein
MNFILPIFPVADVDGLGTEANIRCPAHTLSLREVIPVGVRTQIGPILAVRPTWRWRIFKNALKEPSSLVGEGLPWMAWAQ